MNFITSCNFQISVLYTFSCRRQRAEFASAAFMYKVCVLIEILFLKGGFLSAIASIGLLIALAMTPHDGKNQSKRMGKWLFGLSQKGIFSSQKIPLTLLTFTHLISKKSNLWGSLIILSYTSTLSPLTRESLIMLFSVWERLIIVI